MAESDALEVINSWRHVLVKGRQAEQIDRFLEEAGKRFAALGWSRDPTSEGPMNRDERQLNRFYCWVSGAGPRPQVLLCLNRSTDRRVRGSTYFPPDNRPGLSLSELANTIQHVLAEVLEPAAAAVGLEVTYPRFGPISRVGARTTSALTAFAEAGDGQWPLPDALEPAWRKFVVTAFREDVAFQPEELIAWFKASGWEERPAVELAKRFSADAALLGQYEEEEDRQPA
jgi:hypothetical protein